MTIKIERPDADAVCKGLPPTRARMVPAVLLGQPWPTLEVDVTAEFEGDRDQAKNRLERCWASRFSCSRRTRTLSTRTGTAPPDAGRRKPTPSRARPRSPLSSYASGPRSCLRRRPASLGRTSPHQTALAIAGAVTQGEPMNPDFPPEPPGPANAPFRPARGRVRRRGRRRPPRPVVAVGAVRENRPRRRSRPGRALGGRRRRPHARGRGLPFEEIAEAYAAAPPTPARWPRSPNSATLKPPKAQARRCLTLSGRRFASASKDAIDPPSVMAALCAMVARGISRFQPTNRTTPTGRSVTTWAG